MDAWDRAGESRDTRVWLSVDRKRGIGSTRNRHAMYRMDRFVFQVLQERSPACQDCRCDKRPCVLRTASSSCARNVEGCGAKIWRTTLDTTSSETDKATLIAPPVSASICVEEKPCIPFTIERRSICHRPSGKR